MNNWTVSRQELTDSFSYNKITRLNQFRLGKIRSDFITLLSKPKRKKEKQFGFQFRPSAAATFIQTIHLHKSCSQSADFMLSPSVLIIGLLDESETSCGPACPPVAMAMPPSQKFRPRVERRLKCVSLAKLGDGTDQLRAWTISRPSSARLPVDCSLLATQTGVS